MTKDYPESTAVAKALRRTEQFANHLNSLPFFKNWSILRTMVEKLILALILLAGLYGFIKPVSMRLRHVFRARGKFEAAPLGPRILRFIWEVLLQGKVISERPIAGALHAIVFWGFIAFGGVTMEHFARGFGFSIWGSHRIGQVIWFVATVFAWLVIVSMAGLAFRRFVLKPPTLGKFSSGSLMVTALIMILMITHVIEPRFHDSPFASKVNWWIHALAIVGFLFLIPNSKHLHLVLSPFTTFFKGLRLADIRPLDLQNGDYFGAETLPQLSKHTALGAFTCVECGRCRDHCPATNTGKLLNPKQLMLDLRAGYLSKPEGRISGEVVPEEVFWQCTTCGACTFQCPVGIDQVVPILETRRGLVANGTFPEEMRPLFENLERSGNPWGYARQDAEKFIDESGFPDHQKGKVLFWMGCMGRYDEKYKKTTQAFAKILNHAGVEWGVMRNESCTGDAARRAGNEFLFSQMAEANIAALNEAAPSMIATSCPHCLRTLSEYKDMGLAPNIELRHHTDLIDEWQKTGKLPSKSGSGEVTYHDPCYLSRYEGIVDEPRDVLSRTGMTLKEPQRSKEHSFCCGAGGAMLFTEEKKGERINRNRTDELLATKAETIAVGCPFCKLMIGDGIADRGKSNEVKLRDIAEITADSIRLPVA